MSTMHRTCPSVNCFSMCLYAQQHLHGVGKAGVGSLVLHGWQ